MPVCFEKPSQTQRIEWSKNRFCYSIYMLYYIEEKPLELLFWSGFVVYSSNATATILKEMIISVFLAIVWRENMRCIYYVPWLGEYSIIISRGYVFHLETFFHCEFRHNNTKRHPNIHLYGCNDFFFRSLAHGLYSP